MEELSLLANGFGVILTWQNIGLMMIGILLGIIVGVLPGLGGPNGVAILLPLTFGMSPTSAIILLSCIYWAHCLAAQSLRCCSISQVRHGQLRQPLTVIPWHKMGKPALH